MMKKNLRRVFAIMLVTVLLMTNTSAIVLEKISQAEASMLKRGLTREEADNVLAIVYYIDELHTSLFTDNIMKKYRKLGTWQETARAYGVEPQKLHGFVENKVRIRAAVTIPDPIYYEMVDVRMTDDECREFGIRASRLGMDITAAWEAHKKGEDLERAAEKYKANMNARSQAAIDILLGEIPEKEYIEKMRKIAPELTNEEVLVFLEDTAKQWVDERVSTSGITEEELEMGAQIGFSSSRQIFDLCRMKEAEKITMLSYAEMIELVKNGESIDDIVNGNVSKNETESLCFVDLEEYAWASEAINTLARDGIVRGTSETTFSPERNITRADFAVLLVRALELKNDNTENFSDVVAGDYFAAELAVARNSGIISGMGENRFAPRNFITREDAMTVAYRAIELSGTRFLSVEGITRAENYQDYKDVKSYATDAVSSLVGAGIVNGKNGKIEPGACITRAEVGVLINRILTYIKN